MNVHICQCNKKCLQDTIKQEGCAAQARAGLSSALQFTGTTTVLQCAARVLESLVFIAHSSFQKPGRQIF